MLERTGTLLRSRSSPWSVCFRVFVVAFLLVAGTTALITFILPESYASTARIKVEPDVTEVAGTEQSQGASSLHDHFLQTEFEVIQSAAVLDKVIEALGLNVVWGKKYAGGEQLETSETLALLKSRLDLRSVRNKSLMEIRFFSENPDEAANIANAIAEAYREHRSEKARQLANGGVKTLKDLIEEQEPNVREAQKEVDRLRKELNVPDADVNAPPPQLEAEDVRQLQGQLIAFETHLVREETQLKELEKLSPERRRDAIQTSVGFDSEMSTLLGELNIAKQALLSLQKDYAPDHPAMQNAKLMAEDALRRVTARLEGLMIGLSNNVSTARATVASLKTSLEKARSTDIQKAERSRPYYEAKQRLENLQRYRAILATNLASGKIEEPLLRSIPVEIVDKAMPGTRPVRPNKPLNLFLGTVGGAVLAVVVGAVAALVAFLIGRNSRTKSATR